MRAALYVFPVGKNENISSFVPLKGHSLSNLTLNRCFPATYRLLYVAGAFMVVLKLKKTCLSISQSIFKVPF